MSQAELRVTSGKQAGNSIPLQQGKFLVGREEDCHLRPNSDLVSRHHCVFTVDDYGIRLRDLGSTNGTFLNGERIKGGVTLKLGDKVSIGKLEFELVDPSAEATSTNLSAEMNTQITQPDTGTADEEALNDIISGAEDSQSDEPSNSETITDLPQMSPEYGQQPPPEGDTQFMQPGMPMPQMGYPMGYPQQMMPYGYPQYPPGMYPPQMGYPQQFPGMYPQQPMPEQQQPEQGEAPKVEEPAIRLPDPSTTGAKVEPPKPAEGGEGKKTADQKSKEEAPGAAGDIIQQYLNRRPSKE